MFMFVRATGAIIAPISLMRWNAAVSIGRRQTMKDIERRIAILDIKDELAKTLKSCPFCGGSLSEFPGVMIFEKRMINTDLYHVP